MNIVIEDYICSPKARPRLGKGGNVYSPSTKGENGLAWMMKAYVLEHHPNEKIPIEGKISVVIVVLSEKNLRGDIDNYEKFFYDALQKSGIIVNDKQIRRKFTELIESATVNEVKIDISCIKTMKMEV